MDTVHYFGMAKRKEPDHDAARQADIEQIAARLVLLRTVRGLRPSDLCEMTGIARNTYSQWENGKGRPPLDAARILVKHFGITLDWLYDGDPSALPMALGRAIAEAEQQRQPQAGKARS